MCHSLLRQIQAEHVSVWLDGVTRSQLRSGELAGLVRDLGVSGVTTDPTLFAASLDEVSEYASDLADLRARRLAVGEAARLLAADDARRACDVLLPTYQLTSGVDGWVSIDVDPASAHDAAAMLAQVRALRWLVDRPNLMVKIPATPAGVAAIAAATADGHCINATLIFSVDRYREVLGAYASGLARARTRGLDISTIHSVASLFVSRVDVALAALSASSPGDGARQAGPAGPFSPFALAGVANARRAHRCFQSAMSTVAWRELVAEGAHPQRLLWASTGVADPAWEPTAYVAGLAVPGTVSTMPLTTLTAAAEVPRQSLRDGSDRCDVLDLARGVERVDAAGDSLPARLLDDGVATFQHSWSSVLDVLGRHLGPWSLRGRSVPYERWVSGDTLFSSVDP